MSLSRIGGHAAGSKSVEELGSPPADWFRHEGVEAMRRGRFQAFYDPDQRRRLGWIAFIGSADRDFAWQFGIGNVCVRRFKAKR